MKKNKDDKLWAKKVLERDKYLCQICKKNFDIHAMHAHHIIPSRFDDVRLLVSNGMTLCVNHHMWGKYSAHKNPLWFAKWLEINKPDIYYWAMNYLESKFNEEISKDTSRNI